VPSRPRVLLLHTGGTLGMAGGRPSSLRPAPFARTLRERVPELAELADVQLELSSNLDSSEIQPEAWVRLARSLAERLPEVDGAVVTHGTDTLAYTASALSFLLPGLDRPVVLTGSQRPLGEVRTDARLNLIDAVTSALRGPPEVTVCFDSKLYRGNRTLKRAVAEYDAFESPNFPLLGTLGVTASFARGLRPRRLRLADRLDPRVFLLKVFPGLDPELPRALLTQVRGLVVEAYGAGNVPVDARGGRSLLPVFREARTRGLPVVVVSQAHHNAVDLSLYEGGAAALAEGAISGGDMTSVAAVTKLMHVLGTARSLPEIRRAMERSVAGERS
jgi:L-asparaginase